MYGDRKWGIKSFIYDAIHVSTKYYGDQWSGVGI